MELEKFSRFLNPYELKIKEVFDHIRSEHREVEKVCGNCALFIDTSCELISKLFRRKDTSVNALNDCPCRDCIITMVCNKACEKRNLFSEYLSYKYNR